MLAKRRTTTTVMIDNIPMGSAHPVVIQSMTNTPTSDTDKTIAQVKELADAGSELVRLTVNDFDAAKAVPHIKKVLLDDGYTTPLIGDFHFNGHILLDKFPDMAASLSKFRINPGNVGKGNRRDEQFTSIINIARDLNKPVRIGVNFGSLDQDLFTSMMDENAASETPLSSKDVIYKAMISSALANAELAESLGLNKDKIVLSVKMSDVQDMITVYEKLATACEYVLHLGLTEAGGRLQGIASSSAALAVLLQQGYGDTIRMSLTPEPGVGRRLEVDACKTLLQSLGFRYFMPRITSCPGCGRTNSDKFTYLAKDISTYIEKKMPAWKTKYPGVETLTVAVMGCVVNGPGESKHADIGISLPGISEKPAIPVYTNGSLSHTLKGDDIKDDFIQILNTYIKDRFETTTL